MFSVSLIGHLAQAAKVVTPGRTFIRHMLQSCPFEEGVEPLDLPESRDAVRPAADQLIMHCNPHQLPTQCGHGRGQTHGYDLLLAWPSVFIQRTMGSSSFIVMD